MGTRRTKSDLIKAEQRRFEQVESLIDSKQVLIKQEQDLPNHQLPKSQPESNVSWLFEKTFGYQLKHIKKDLLKTAGLTFLICLILVLTAALI